MPSKAATLELESLRSCLSMKRLEAEGGRWARVDQAWVFQDNSSGYFEGATRVGPRFVKCTIAEPETTRQATFCNQLELDLGAASGGCRG